MPAPTTTLTPQALPGLDDVLALVKVLPGPDAWRAELDAMRVRPGVYMNDGDPDPDPKPDPKPDDDPKADDDPDDDEDEEPADLAAARKALAKMRRERKAEKAEQEKAKAKEAREAGRYKELYEEAEAKREKAEADQEKRLKAGYVTAAAGRLKAYDPEDLVAILGAEALEDIDSEADAERELKRLRKRKPHLFEKDGPRQVRDAGRRKGDDDEDDDEDDPKKKKPPVSTLRRGLEAAQKERAGSST